MSMPWSASLLLVAACLAGCGKADHDVSINQAIRMHDGSIAIRASGRPDADINANGDLSIDDQMIAVTPAQRDLLKRYYASALAIRDHGIATGEAGAKVAGTAIGSVVKGLASGDTDKIDSEVNASAAKVEAQAAHICEDLQQMHALQDSLSAQLEAFRPYAVLDGTSADECRRDLKDHDHNGSGNDSH